MMRDIGLIQNSDRLAASSRKHGDCRRRQNVEVQSNVWRRPAVREIRRDTSRMFVLFAAPPEKEVDWRSKARRASTASGRVYRFVTRNATAGRPSC